MPRRSYHCADDYGDNAPPYFATFAKLDPTQTDPATGKPGVPDPSNPLYSRGVANISTDTGVETQNADNIAAALDSLAGEPVTVDLAAAGPWLPAESAPFSKSLPAAETAGTAELPMAAKPGVDAAESPTTDSLRGTVTLHNANWKADFLANHLEIAQATLHLLQGDLRWDPVVFSYGPVKGTASLYVPAHCGAAESCQPKFQVQFGNLDAGALQAAILGAHEKGTLLSTLIARFRPASSSNAPVWPPLEGTVKADALALGPVTLTDASAGLRILSTGAEITDLDADLLGGHVHGGGMLSTSADQAKAAYTLEGHFEKLSPTEVGQLLGLKWSGGVFQANGKIDLSGFTSTDLAASAKGTLHFEWRHGVVASVPILKFA